MLLLLAERFFLKIKMMKILISGGAGFIGSRLAAHLARLENDVVVMDNLSAQIHGGMPIYYPDELTTPGVRFIRGDVTSREDWESALDDVDAVYHLAAETGTAQSMYKISHYNFVNTCGTALLFDVLARRTSKPRKVILASSRSVYGEGAYRCNSCEAIVYPEPRSVETLKRHEWDPVCSCCSSVVVPVHTPENAKVSPASIYAATKYAQEDIVRIGSEALGIDSVIFRFQNVYGEGQSLNNPYTGILSIFSTRIRRGLSLPIFEDGHESRDFVHVSDVVAALSLALEKNVPNGSVYNVGSGVPTSVLDLADMLVKKLRGSVQPHVTGEFRVGDIRHCYADLTRIQHDLGFSPKISLDRGLDRFCDWVNGQPLPEDGLDRANKELRERGLMSV